MSHISERQPGKQIKAQVNIDLGRLNRRSKAGNLLFNPWLASYVAIVVDKAKAAAMGVLLMDLASQEQGSALPDSHKRLSRSSERECRLSLE